MDLAVATVDNNSQLLLDSLVQFFNVHENHRELVAILDHSINQYNTKISLRILDWFVTNYAKKHQTSYMLQDGTLFEVYPAYKQMLKSFSKKQFDPFCRRTRTEIALGDVLIETTVAQLNFLRWCFQNSVLLYLSKHYKDVETDMVKTLSTPKTETGKKKHHSVSPTDINLCSTRARKVVVSFD